MKKIINFKILLLILFLISILISHSFVNKFENKYFTTNDYNYSSLYHEDTLSYFKSAEKISEDLSNGKSFFISGSSYNFSFLYPRVIFIFNNIFNKNSSIFNYENKEIDFKNYKFFIFIQIIFYYLSVIFFHSKISKSVKGNLANITSVILCINPILMQWHLTMLTESFFLALLIFLLGFLINSKNNSHFFLIGLIIGILYMQRTVALFYPFIFLIFIYLIKENILRKSLKIISMLFGICIILFVIGFHNLKRADVFYFTPIQSKIDLQTYLEPSILSNAKGLSNIEINSFIQERSKKILYENKFDMKKEKDKIIFLNLIRNQSINNILENKALTAKIISKNYLHSMLLNPVQVYYASKYRDWIDFKNSKDHPFWVKVRIIITIIFFICSTIGFFYSFKKFDLKLNLYMIFSCLYFFGVSCWLGNTRYFTPSVLFMTIYFSVFLNEVISKYFKRTNQ